MLHIYKHKFKLCQHRKDTPMNPRSSKSRFPMQDNTVYVITFLVFLLSSYFITLGGLLILSLLLYKIPLDDSAVNIGIVLIYVLSNFLTAFICGRKMNQKKFIWGLLLGSAYFFILLLISFISNQSVHVLGSNVITAFLICAGAGTLGGMLA